MFDHLQIYEPRERVLVGLADLALWPFGLLPARRPSRLQRVLLLRLERIGDLLMVLDAIRLLRESLPDAEIDLAVGSWNAPIACLLPEITRVDVVDAPWLARGTRASWTQLSDRTREWRDRYDLVINFEPDIRSNALAWLSRAPRRAGYWTGGGGALLTEAHAYDPTRHVADNARELVRRTMGSEPFSTDRGSKMPEVESKPTVRVRPLAPLGPDLWKRAPTPSVDALLATVKRPWIGVHVSGGRESKQWHLDRFATVARQLAVAHHATIVLTGTTADRPLVDQVRRDLPDVAVVDACGMLDLLELAGLLHRLDLLITSDTGPMHLASAVGTPVVALFGPSDPRRYGPLADHHAVIRVDLWCSPCGQVRLPPARCRGHVPDCMDGITVERVVAAATALLSRAKEAG